MSIIVVVDDRRTNLKILAKLAASLGDNIIVKPFPDPREALQWSRSNVPDLVVTDFKMPGLDGAEFTRLFRQDPHCFDVPVMVVTAYEDRSFRYAALEAGATDFLLSPVDHHEFRARSRNLLTLRQQQLMLKQRAFTLEKKIAHESNLHARALRDSHESLLRVIDTVPAMISATTVDGRYEFMNTYQASLFGVSPDEAVGRTPAELMPGDYADRVIALDRAMFDTCEAPSSFEEEFIALNGSRRVFLTTKSPLRDETGAVAKVVTVSLDITERKHVEEALILAKEAAEVANRSKTEFLANMSHELRTPLNAIIGFSQVITSQLLGPVGTERYLEYAKNIEESGSLLYAIINDILDVSKIEAGKVELHDEVLAVPAMIEDVVRLVHERASVAGVELQVVCRDPLDPLRADAAKLKQILLNLVTNAIKFTLAGGKVSIITAQTEDALEIRIVDTGIGMDENELKIAITRFGQVESTTSRTQRGTGLGLPLAIGLVELHGGTLAISSKKGIGTNVVVRFPSNRLVPRRQPQSSLTVR